MHTRNSELPLTQRQRIPIQTLYRRPLWGGQPFSRRRAVNGDLRTTLTPARHSVSQMYLCEEAGEVPRSDRPVRRLYFRLPSQGAMPQRSLQQLPSSYECLNDRRLFRIPYELAPASPRDSPMIAQAPPVRIPTSPQGYRGHVPQLLLHQRPQLSISQINQRAFRRDATGLVRPIEPPKSLHPISPRIAQIPPLLAPEDRPRRTRASPLLMPHISRTNAASSGRAFKIPRISTRDTPRIARSPNIYGSGEGGGIKPTQITRKQLENQESKEKDEVLNKLEDLQALRRELMKDIIKDDDEDGGDDEEEGEEAEDDDNDDVEEDEDEDDDESTLIEPLYMARGKKDDVQGTSDAESNVLSTHSFNFTNEAGEVEGELLDGIEDPLEEYSISRAQFRRLNRRFLNKVSNAYEQFENSIVPTPFHLWYEEEPEDDYIYM